MPSKRRIREYHPSNPKIDVYTAKWRYEYSTNWFSHCSDAIAEFRKNHPNIIKVYARIDKRGKR